MLVYQHGHSPWFTHYSLCSSNRSIESNDLFRINPFYRNLPGHRFLHMDRGLCVKHNGRVCHLRIWLDDCPAAKQPGWSQHGFDNLYNYGCNHLPVDSCRYSKTNASDN